MSIKGQTVTDKFGFTRDKMYIDDLSHEAIFEFFKENAPVGVGFGTTEEIVQDYQFKDNDMFYNKDKGKMDCLYTPKHRVALGNVCAGFSFDDFTCEYYDNTANKVDLSKEWCKFVCAELDSMEYFMDFYIKKSEQISALRKEYKEKEQEIFDEITDIGNNINRGNSTESSIDFGLTE